MLVRKKRFLQTYGLLFLIVMYQQVKNNCYPVEAPTHGETSMRS